MKKLKSLCIRLFKFLRHLVLNPRFLLCFGLAWLITNGWSYILFGLGMLFDISWMTAVAGAYMAALWLPFTPEKILTLAIAFGLRRLIFPKDKKTEEQLKLLKPKDRDEDDIDENEDDDEAKSA